MDDIYVNGNLGADARVGNKSQNGSTPVSFPVLVNKRYVNRSGEDVERTNRYSCTIWATSDKYLGYLSNNLKKGAGVTLRGEPAPAFYTSKDGQTIPYITIRIDSLEINRKAAVPTVSANNDASSSDDGSVFVPDSHQVNDDLPF